MEARQQAAESALFDQTELLPKRKLLVVFSALAITLLIGFVDQTGIGVALPTIGEELNASNTISWAGTSALIANTIFQVLYGRLPDSLGRKAVFLLALSLLAVSDLLCGFSQKATMLYVFRGLAGVADGGITSLSMMIISDTVTLKERGKYQGILGACVGLGNIIGPFLGALFVQKSTWRGLLWLISPLAALAAVVCAILFSNNRSTSNLSSKMRQLDYWSLLCSTAAIMLILVPVPGGRSYFEWNSPMVISMLSLGVVSSALFIFIEARSALLPMIPLSIFKSGPVTILLLQNLLFGRVYYSQLYQLPLDFQNARQMSPTASAALLLAVPAAQMVLSIVSGEYISRMERYGEVIWSGFVLWTIGIASTCVFDTGTSVGVIVIVLLVQGAGVGLVFQPVLVALQAHCTKAQRAVIISKRNFLRSLGGALGLAVSAMVLHLSSK